MRSLRFAPVRAVLGLPTVLVLLAGRGWATAQEEHFHVHGEEKWTLASVRSVGDDLDGDGIDDLVLGGQIGGTNGGGVVIVVSGHDGATLQGPIFGPFDYDFGYWVTGVGDFDGDGIGDYATGVPDNGPANYGGEVRVFSGADSRELALIPYPGMSDGTELFGTRVDPLGDLDGDGFPEFAVPDYASREVFVISGPDGHLLRRHSGSRAGRPCVVAAFGDRDGDGVEDYVVGGDQGAGEAYVCSGATGKVVLRLEGQDGGQHFGSGVARLGDRDGDGIGDFAVSSDRSYGCTGGSFGPKVVEFFSGKSGHSIGRLAPPRPSFWWTSCAFWDLHGGEDVNGDGVLDLMAAFPNGGDWGNLYGFVAVYSGATGTMLWRAKPEGIRMGLVGDLDGDGLSEWAHGAGSNSEHASYGGKVTVFRGFPGDAHRVCSSSPNSTGNAAQLSLEGPISISNNELHLAVDGAVPDRVGMFLAGTEYIQVPFGDGVLCVGGGLSVHHVGSPVRLDSQGSVMVRVNMHDPEGRIPSFRSPDWTPGSTWVLQFLYADPAAGGAGFNLSDAMLTTFTP